MELNISAKAYTDALKVFAEKPVEKTLAYTLNEIGNKIRKIWRDRMKEYGASNSTINYLIHAPKIDRGRLIASVAGFKKGITLGNYSPQQTGKRWVETSKKRKLYRLIATRTITGNVSISIKGKREVLPYNYFMVAPGHGGKAVLKRTGPHVKGQPWSGVETALGPGPVLVGENETFMQNLKKEIYFDFEKQFTKNLTYYLGGFVKR